MCLTYAVGVSVPVRARTAATPLTPPRASSHLPCFPALVWLAGCLWRDCIFPLRTPPAAPSPTVVVAGAVRADCDVTAAAAAKKSVQDRERSFYVALMLLLLQCAFRVRTLQ